MARNGVASIWPEADAKLRQRWAAGVPCIQIGVELGVSSRSVIGRAGRLELGRHPLRAHVVLQPRKPYPPRVIKPKQPAAPQPAVAAPAPRPIGTCQFISGDVRRPGWRFCDAPVSDPGSPWCAKHRRVVFHPRSAVRMPADGFGAS